MIKELLPGLGKIVELSATCWCGCVCTGSGSANDYISDKDELEVEDPQISPLPI